MKKRYSLLFLLFFSINGLSAYPIKKNGIYYQTIPGYSYQLEVTFPVKKDQRNNKDREVYTGKMIIPESFTQNGKEYRVSKIGEEAFKECSIESLQLPNSIVEIGTNAFYHCYSLRTIELKWTNPPPTTKRNSPTTEDTIYGFSLDDFENIRLIVPVGSKQKYRSHPIWNQFAKIEELTNKEGKSDWPKEIGILKQTVILELDKGKNYPCIIIHLSDMSLNKGLGTYLEIKQKGATYLMQYRYQITEFPSVEAAAKAYLKDLFYDFYEDKNYCNKVWGAFLREGGFEQFMKIALELIDYPFLHSPFNDKYG